MPCGPPPLNHLKGTWYSVEDQRFFRLQHLLNVGYNQYLRHLDEVADRVHPPQFSSVGHRRLNKNWLGPFRKPWSGGHHRRPAPEPGLPSGHAQRSALGASGTPHGLGAIAHQASQMGPVVPRRLVARHASVSSPLGLGIPAIERKWAWPTLIVTQVSSVQLHVTPASPQMCTRWRCESGVHHHDHRASGSKVLRPSGAWIDRGLDSLVRRRSFQRLIGHLPIIERLPRRLTLPTSCIRTIRGKLSGRILTPR